MIVPPDAGRTGRPPGQPEPPRQRGGPGPRTGSGTLAQGDRSGRRSLTEARFGAALQRSIGWGALRYGARRRVRHVVQARGVVRRVREDGDTILGAAAYVEAEVRLGPRPADARPGRRAPAVHVPGRRRAPVPGDLGRPAGRSGPEIAPRDGALPPDRCWVWSTSATRGRRSSPGPRRRTRSPRRARSTPSWAGRCPLGGGLRVGAEAYAKRVDAASRSRSGAPAPEFTTRLTAARATSARRATSGPSGRRAGRSTPTLAYGYGRTEYQATQSDFGILFGDAAPALRHPRTTAATRSRPRASYRPRRFRRRRAVAVRVRAAVTRGRSGSTPSCLRSGSPRSRPTPGTARVLFDGRSTGVSRPTTGSTSRRATEVPLGARAALDVQAGAHQRLRPRQRPVLRRLRWPPCRPAPARPVRLGPPPHPVSRTAPRSSDPARRSPRATSTSTPSDRLGPVVLDERLPRRLGRHPVGPRRALDADAPTRRRGRSTPS